MRTRLVTAFIVVALLSAAVLVCGAVADPAALLTAAAPEAAGLFGPVAAVGAWLPVAVGFAFAPAEAPGAAAGVVPGLALPAASTSVFVGTVGSRSAKMSEARNGPSSFASGIFSVI